MGINWGVSKQGGGQTQGRTGEGQVDPNCIGVLQDPIPAPLSISLLYSPHSCQKNGWHGSNNTQRSRGALLQFKNKSFLASSRPLGLSIPKDAAHAPLLELHVFECLGGSLEMVC